MCMHTTPLAAPEFWLLSAEIIGVDVILTLILLLGVRRALIDTGKSMADVLPIVSTLGFVLFGWFAIALLLAWRGVFRTALDQPVPYIAFAIGIPILVGTFLIRRSPTIREIVAAVPQSWLVAVQFFRVVGGTFLILHGAGQLPGIFALPAGYGDVFVGLTALLVGVRCARNQSDRLVTLWNWIGIADLIVAVATGFLSSPSRLQIFSLDAPNVLIGSFPLALIPVYAVPLFILLHLASLTKVRDAHRADVKQMASV